MLQKDFYKINYKEFMINNEFNLFGFLFKINNKFLILNIFMSQISVLNFYFIINLQKLYIYYLCNFLIHFALHISLNQKIVLNYLNFLLYFILIMDQKIITPKFLEFIQNFLN